MMAFSYEGIECGGWEGLREFAKDFGQSTEIIDRNKLQFIRLMNQLKLGCAVGNGGCPHTVKAKGLSLPVHGGVPYLPR